MQASSGWPTTLLSPFGRGGYTSCCRWAIGRGVLRCLGTQGRLCVAAAVKVRDAPQFRHCWAVDATGWVTNNLNTLLAGVGT